MTNTITYQNMNFLSHNDQHYHLPKYWPSLLNHLVFAVAPHTCRVTLAAT